MRSKGRTYSEKYELLKLNRPPFKPSWVDLLNGWVDRLNLSGFLVFFILYLVICTTLIGVELISGVKLEDLNFQIFVFQLFVLEVFYFNYYLHYLTLDALETFRGFITISESDYEGLKFEFLFLPARVVTLLTFAAVVFGLVLTNLGPTLFDLDRELNIGLFISSLTSWFLSGLAASIIVYRLVHQTRMVARIYERIDKIDLFNLRPIYTLSSLLAKSSFFLLFIIYSSFLYEPSTFQITGFVLATVAISIIAITGLAFPLLGINRRIVEEKQEQLQKSGLELRKAFEKISSIAQGEGKLADYSGVIDAVIKKRNYIEGIPTWPWSPATIRALASALILPLAIWLIQGVLARVLGI